MSRFPRIAPYLLVPLLNAMIVALTACSSPKPKFQDDELLSSAPNQFSHTFNYSSAEACEASRRALLSQGYMTTMTHDDTVDASKNFQPGSDSHIVVEVHVVCTPGDAANASVVYVNAVQNGYALKKSDTSASVGLSILGSVSLPIRSNSDAMVKISSETIQSGAFYKRFFELVGRYVGTVRTQPVPSGAIEITPLPPVVATAPASGVNAAAAPASAATVAAADHAASAPQAAAAPAAPSAQAPTAIAAAAASLTAPNVTSAAAPASATAATAATAAATPAAATTAAATPATHSTTASAAP